MASHSTNNPTGSCREFSFRPNTNAGSVQTLQPNEPLQRELAGEEVHRYRFFLKENEFFQVRIEQKGIDVLLKLVDANGKILSTMDTPNGNSGPETLSFVALKGQFYELQIWSLDSRVDKGNYIIKRESPREATKRDRMRVEAEHLFMEGIRTRESQGLRETSIARLEEAYSLWNVLGDEYLKQLTHNQIEQINATKDPSNVRQLRFGETVTRPLRVVRFIFTRSR